MTRRSVLVALAVIAAVAVAVPSIAAVDDSNNIKRVDNELRKLAHKALKKANKALKMAKQPGPQGPAGAAGAAGPPGGPAAPAFAEAPGLESTADDTQFVQLPGGPSVTVNVPQAASAPPGTGFIEVVASAGISDEAGAVALYEDGGVIGENDQCAQALGFPEPPLFASLDGLQGTYGTPGTLDPITAMCATTGEPGPVTFITTPGTHTYELWYAYCGCSGTDADFFDRRIWITPLG